MTSPSRRKVRMASLAERAPGMEVGSGIEAPKSPDVQSLGRLSLDGVLSDASDTVGHNQQVLQRIYRLIAQLQAGEHSRLHDHQLDVMQDIAEFIASPTMNDEGTPITWGHVKLPTGAGKTVIFSTLAGVLSSQIEDKDTPKGLILVPKLDLVSQTIGSNGKDGNKARGLAGFAEGVAVSQYTGQRKSLNGDVVVMTYQSLRNAVASGKVSSGMFDYVLCDEAHRAIGDKTFVALDAIAGTVPVIGFSATLDFERKQVSSYFPEEIHSTDLREAIELGWLSPVRGIAVTTEVELPEVVGGGDFREEELVTLIESEWRNEKALSFVHDFVSQGQQGVVSCVPGNNLEHARTMAQRINTVKIIDAKTGKTRYIRAEVVDGAMSEETREAIFRRYEKGEIDVLTYVDLLTEGWDSDAAQFLINLRPTTSPVNAIQRIGRVLRPVPGKAATVVEFIDRTERPLYTFWHAMGEERIEQFRVFSSDEDEEEGEGAEDALIEKPTKKVVAQFSSDLQQLIGETNHVLVKDVVVERQKVLSASADDIVLRDYLHSIQLSRKAFEKVCAQLHARGVEVATYPRVHEGVVRESISREVVELLNGCLDELRPQLTSTVMTLSKLREIYRLGNKKVVDIITAAGIEMRQGNLHHITPDFNGLVFGSYIALDDVERFDAMYKQKTAEQHEKIMESSAHRPQGSYDVRISEMVAVTGMTPKQIDDFLASCDPEYHPKRALDTSNASKPVIYYPKSEVVKLVKAYAAQNGYTEKMLADPFLVRNHIIAKSGIRISPEDIMAYASSSRPVRECTVMAQSKGRPVRRVPVVLLREFCDAVIRAHTKSAGK